MQQDHYTLSRFSKTKKGFLLLGVVLFALGINLHYFKEFQDNFKDVSNSQSYSQTKEITPYRNNEKNCLVNALWYEARGESLQGIKAVAEVILNRKDSGKYPDTICEVVFQEKQFSYVSQQGLGINDAIETPYKAMNDLDSTRGKEIEEIAGEALERGSLGILPEGTLHYAHKKVRNNWTRKFKVVKVVGKHKFYKEGI
jgi:hypothetical protein